MGLTHAPRRLICLRDGRAGAPSALPPPAPQPLRGGPRDDLTETRLLTILIILMILGILIIC